MAKTRQAFSFRDAQKLLRSQQDKRRALLSADGATEEKLQAPAKWEA